MKGTVNGAPLRLGQLGLRTITGGVAYTRRLAQLEATFGFALGYGFGSFDLSDPARDGLGRQGIFGIESDATNALVLTPRVSLWQNVSNRLAVGVTGTYVRSEPTVRLISGDFTREQSVDATAIRLSAGIGFKVF